MPDNCIEDLIAHAMTIAIISLIYSYLCPMMMPCGVHVSHLIRVTLRKPTSGSILS